MKFIKDTELHRYKIDKMLGKQLSRYFENKFDFTPHLSAIFAAGVSILTSNLFSQLLMGSNWGWYVLTVFVLIFFYFLFYFAGRIIFPKIERFVKSHTPYSKPIGEIKEETTNSFNHLSCVYVLIAKRLINEFQFSTTKDIEQATYCYYEIIYYLKTAACETKKLFFCIGKDDNNEEIYLCINIGSIVNGIDLYRIINLYNMMKEIFEFVEENKNRIDIDNRLRSSLLYDIGGIKKDLEYIERKSEELIRRKNNVQNISSMG